MRLVFGDHSVSLPFLKRGNDPSQVTSTEALLPSSPGADTDEHLWQPITGGRGGFVHSRQLPDLTQKQMIDFAHYFYKGNPLGKRIVDITAEYCIGEGIRFNSEDPQIRSILNTHWANPTNNWTINQFERVRDLGLVGEMVIPTFVNPSNGSVSLGMIDTGLIERVIYDPDNMMKPYAVILHKLKGESVRRAYKVINTSNADMSNSAHGRLVGLPRDSEEQKDWDEPFKMGDKVEPRRNKLPGNYSAEWHGQCFYFKVNAPLTSSRGWSDLLADLDWIDAHDQFLFSQVEKAVNAGNYVMDTTVKGATETTLRKFAQTQARISPGQRYYHNENVENKFLSPDLRLEDATFLAGILKNHILGGVGLPPVWFAESMTSRASAPEMTDPSFKRIKIRQRYIAYAMTTILRYVLDTAFIYGRLRMDRRSSLPNRANIESESFYLKMPDVSAKDQRMLAIATRNLSGALKEAVEAGFTDQEVARKMFSQFLEFHGLNSWEQEPQLPTPIDDRDELDPTKVFKLITEAQKKADGGSPELSRGGHTYYFSWDFAA